MDSLLTVATQVGILFALMSVGFVARKTRLLGDAAIKGFVDFLVVVVTPALVIHAFERPFDSSMLCSLALAFAFAIGGHFVAIVLATAFLRHRSAPTENVLKVAAVFSNAGFMGIPLEYALFGSEGVFYGVVYVGVFNIVMWSWGYCTMRGVPPSRIGRGEARMILINPGTAGLAIGLPIFFASINLPQAIDVPVKCLADINTPLAMVVIGYHLAGAKAGPILRTPMAWAAAAFRLVGYPLLMIGAFSVVGRFVFLDRTMCLALVVSSAAPVAALTAMLAAKYGSDVDMSVGLVSGTTLLSIVTMPPVIAFAMHVL